MYSQCMVHWHPPKEPRKPDVPLHGPSRTASLKSDAAAPSPLFPLRAITVIQPGDGSGPRSSCLQRKNSSNSQRSARTVLR